MFWLSPKDYALAEKIGAERQAVKDANGVITRKVADNLTDQEIHILGAQAEIAVARLVGVEPNLAIHAHGDNGYDLSWSGLTWDVKMRSERHRDLVVMPDMSDFRADAAILCWPGPDFNDVTIVGLVTRERFLREARTDLLRDPLRLVMPWRCLTPITPSGVYK